MALRSRNRRPSGGLAGWLFADISLVLVVIFAATTNETAGSTMPTGSTTTTTSTTTSTTTIATSLPTNPVTSTTTLCRYLDSIGNCLPTDVVPEPVEVTLPVGAGEQGRMRLLALLDEEVANRPDLGSNPKFGVVIAYGGSKGRADAGIGDALSYVAEEHLRTWDRTLTVTYYQGGHHQRVSVGYVKFKLFPIVSE